MFRLCLMLYKILEIEEALFRVPAERAMVAVGAWEEALSSGWIRPVIPGMR